MTVADAVNNALSYIWGQCTRFVATVYSWVPAGWGNAYQWWGNAKAQGYPTGQTPAAGSISVWGQGLPGSGNNGHVAAVTQVNPDGSYVVQEMNYTNGLGNTDTRTVPAGGGGNLLGFIYGPPGTAVPASLMVDTSSSGSGSGSGNAIADAVGSAINSVVDSWVQSALSGISQGASNAGQDVRAYVNNNLIALAVAGAVTAVLMWRMEADSE